MKKLINKLFRKQKKYFEGKTFYVLFKSNQGFKYERLLFVEECEGRDIFYKWLETERKKIEDYYYVECLIINCSVI